MTTLYRPVLMESAEQAEALPVGTAAKDDSLSIAVKSEGGYWARTDVADGLPMIGEASMVGWTALVPIEAEEEWTAMGEDHGDPWIAHVGHDGIDGTREEAEAYTRRFGGFLAHRNRTPWEEA